MKKFLFSLLIFSMCTSTLVCADGHDAHAGTRVSSRYSGTVNNTHHREKKELLHFCHRIKMQLPAHVDIGRPHLKSGQPIAIENHAWMPTLLANTNTVHDPPLVADPPAPARPVFLMTQRLRI